MADFEEQISVCNWHDAAVDLQIMPAINLLFTDK
jgi:hypothetical protein